MSYYSDLIQAASPVGYWQLDDNNGTTTVVATVGSNGTLAGATTAGVSAADTPVGIGGNSYHFDGADDTISLGDSTNFEFSTNANMTFEAWVKIDTKKIQAIFYKHDEFFLSIGEEAGVDQFYAKTGPAATYSGYQYKIENTPRSIGVWYHVAVVYSSGSIGVYVNGNALSNTNTFSGTTVPTATANVMRIGSEVSSRYFDGFISHAAIYTRALGVPELLTHYQAGTGYRTLAVTNVPTISFSAPAPTVLVISPADVTESPSNTPAVTFTAFDANILLGPNIAADVATIAFTAFAPTVKAYTAVTQYSYNGDLKAWLYQPAVNNGSNLYATVNAYGARGNGAFSPGFPNNYNAAGVRLFDDPTIPSDVINYSITIEWQWVSASDSTGNFGVYYNGTIYDYDGPIVGASSGGPYLETFGGLSWGSGYSFAAFTSNNSKSASNYAQINYIRIDFEQSIPTNIVSVDNTPSITFTSYDATVAAANQTNVEVTNTPGLTFQAFGATLQINGAIQIDADPATLIFTAYPATLDITGFIVQTSTNVPEIGFVAFDSVIKINNNVLSFIFIDKSDTHFTALDATAVTNFDMGAILFNEEKIIGFRLGNTSAVPTNFTINAVSTNNLATMVMFSKNKVDYTGTLLVESVAPNGITDTIWVRLTATTSAFIDQGTFLIHVEQIDA